jgi:hypothetical protein
MSQIEKKYFPIKTATACQLKWAWSTIYLNSGVTASCHRTGMSEITAENFSTFHNTPLKLADRTSMLQGKWPEESCKYCKDIEDLGGISDRMRQLTIPNLVPPELDHDNTAINISPTIVEVFFNNTCNLGCLYCNPGLSSTIETENKKFGDFKTKGIELVNSQNQFKNLSTYFWDWFPTGFKTIKRFQFLGGEPFFQKEFDRLLSMIEQYPNSDCEFNIVTNLMVSTEQLESYLDKFKKLLIDKKLKRIDITCSIDCWGPQQEYVRWGLDLNQWQSNFEILVTNKWIYLNINQTISALTIKTIPELLFKLQIWRQHRHIGHWFSAVSPGPSYLHPKILGEEFFEDAEKILSLMPNITEEDKQAFAYMNGILNQIIESKQDLDEIAIMLVYLNEKDRRRKTNWRDIFPWLIKYEVLCGIQE